jgi:hypothetical protein
MAVQGAALASSGLPIGISAIAVPRFRRARPHDPPHRIVYNRVAANRQSGVYRSEEGMIVLRFEDAKQG